MSIKGYATREGTALYGERFREKSAENHFRLEQNLWLSSIGIGTYLGDWDEATDVRYAEAVARAVELGVNVIDSAANYRFQRSERSIGTALKRLTEELSFARNELVICTKGGYLPFDGAPPKNPRRYVEETFVRTGVAQLSDIVAGSHCMTPSYLQHQLGQSLRNMNLDCVDVYYIHNPESQLSEVARAEFDARLRAAFELLERERKDGRLRMYGVATWNGFRVPRDAREYLSLERMAELAREAGGAEHGFRFVQLPFNLAMPEALVLDNQTLGGAEVSLLEAARALGITIVASASTLQGKVARNLPAHIREPLGSLATDTQTAIQFVRSTPGITTALIGMSRREHVEENLRLVRIPPALAEDYQRLFTEQEEQ
ncbi:MAG TPA: aldo/keto reductase [Pyrinomonadaceae bacterium]|jgi:aryl-alcohol dehydrogenase-like predicted oxidoreductase|nr:aldo/keto reductase [Pyrinomonadaceae bacterium]